MSRALTPTRAPLPADTTFVSASDGGQLDGHEVVWSLGNLGPNEVGGRSFVIELADYGVYSTSAHLDYRVGLNDFTLPSNVAETLYAAEPPGEGDGDSGDGDGDMGDGDGDGDTGSGDGDGETGDGDGDTGAGDSGGDSGEDGGAEAGGSAGDDGTGDTGSDATGADGDDGCNCASTPREPSPWAWLGLAGLGLGILRRRSWARR